MKVFKIVLIVAVVVALVAWIRRDFGFPLGAILPFCSDEPALMYDAAGLIALIMTARSVVLLRRACGARR